jgi:transcriptional regulator of acetoin/glycerol metabolism
VLEGAKAPANDDDTRREALIGLLHKHRGNVTAVARATGKARMQIQRWLKRYGIAPKDYRR